MSIEAHKQQQTFTQSSGNWQLQLQHFIDTHSLMTAPLLALILLEIQLLAVFIPFFGLTLALSHATLTMSVVTSTAQINVTQNL